MASERATRTLKATPDRCSIRGFHGFRSQHGRRTKVPAAASLDRRAGDGVAIRLIYRNLGQYFVLGKPTSSLASGDLNARERSQRTFPRYPERHLLRREADL